MEVLRNQTRNNPLGETLASRQFDVLIEARARCCPCFFVDMEDFYIYIKKLPFFISQRKKDQKGLCGNGEKAVILQRISK